MNGKAQCFWRLTISVNLISVAQIWEFAPFNCNLLLENVKSYTLRDMSSKNLPSRYSSIIYLSYLSFNIQYNNYLSLTRRMSTCFFFKTKRLSLLLSIINKAANSHIWEALKQRFSGNFILKQQKYVFFPTDGIWKDDCLGFSCTHVESNSLLNPFF